MFEGHYEEWRHRRIEKLVSLLGGRGAMPGMRVLELAAGHGHVSRMLAEMGAVVTATDGRREHVEFMRNNLEGIHVIHLDQRSGYHIGEFDVVIHWGALYHLSKDRWRHDLADAMSHAPMMCLETEVCDSDDPECIIEVEEHKGYDQSMDGLGVRPSAPAVESAISSIGAVWERHDDPKLNANIHRYDWKVEGTRSWAHGMRRFWICRRK